MSPEAATFVRHHLADAVESLRVAEGWARRSAAPGESDDAATLARLRSLLAAAEGLGAGAGR
jgi:hypothetical protein